MSEQEEPKKARKDFWDILQALGPAIIAATVAILGSAYSHQQTQLAKSAEMREVYTKIMTERETSDNNIRAKMFEMLINAMFSKKEGLTGGTQANARDVKQQIMFLDLLSRNFDTVDIKPLFEDLDSELTKRIYDEAHYSKEQRGELFALRFELRRIGKNLSIKQLNALASLAGSEVKRIVVMEDKDGTITAIPDEPSNGKINDLPVDVRFEQLHDGTIDLTVDYNKSKADDPGFKAPSFYITFYDLPYLDNSVLDKDMRVAVILTKFFSVKELDLFGNRLDKKLAKDYQDLKDSGITKYAEIRLVKFPAKYTGHRDRPYLQEILQDLIDEQTTEKTPEEDMPKSGKSSR